MFIVIHIHNFTISKNFTQLAIRVCPSPNPRHIQRGVCVNLVVILARSRPPTSLDGMSGTSISEWIALQTLPLSASVPPNGAIQRSRSFFSARSVSHRSRRNHSITISLPNDVTVASPQRVVYQQNKCCQWMNRSMKSMDHDVRHAKTRNEHWIRPVSAKRMS